MAAVKPPSRGFDRLSKVYDFLVALVYGRALRRAQTCFLERVPKGSRVLIVGGGTGWFLEELLKRTDLEKVTYVELSEGMLARSRERIEELGLPEAGQKIEWVHGTVHDLPEVAKYDLVCTLCFLDLFHGETLEAEVRALRKRMAGAGTWYFSDFRYADRWPMSWISRGLIWGMYRFFRLTCGIQAGRLGDFHGVLQQAGLEGVDRRTFYGGMLESVWYES